ncbi:hypothetical protein AAVH_28005 [Aphelenchoides avenae]|nr:hypothetical protein AAVH_28005 [Aphelenchus avenae]
MSSKTDVFRLEVIVPRRGETPLDAGIYRYHQRHGDYAWVLMIKRDDGEEYQFDYQLDVEAPDLPEDSEWSFTIYERTTDDDIEYKQDAKIGNDSIGGDPWLMMAREASQGLPVIVGAEITLSTPEVTLPTPESSTWQFQSKADMKDPDVVLVFNGTKFFAHRKILSVVSTVFKALFEADHSASHLPEVDVTKEGLTAHDFEAFLRCIYPCGECPEDCSIVPLTTLAYYYDVQPMLRKCMGILKTCNAVSKLDKLRVAINIGDAELEETVLASLSKDEVRQLFASELKNELGEKLLTKIVERLLEL